MVETWLEIILAMFAIEMSVEGIHSSLRRSAYPAMLVMVVLWRRAVENCGMEAQEVSFSFHRRFEPRRYHSGSTEGLSPGGIIQVPQKV